MNDKPDPPHNAFKADQPETAARTVSEERIERLRLEGGLFVEAVRATRMPMAVTDPNLPGNPIVFANDAFLNLSGYSMDEVLGQQPHFMDGLGTDPADVVAFREALEQDRDAVIETVQYRKDGSRFLASVFLSAFKDEEGRTLHQFLSYLDVTAREQAQLAVSALREAAAIDNEAQLRLLLGTQARWETDADGVVVADSPSWRAYTGQTLEEWLGYGWVNAIHPDDRAYAERQWREAVADRKLVNAEFRLHAPDGEWRWTNVRAVPVLDANGEIGKWAGMNIDIDARKHAEAALRGREEQQAFLLRLSDALREEADADAIANRAISMLSEQLKLDRCYITFYRSADDAADFPYQVGNDSVPPLPVRVRLSDFPEAYEQVREKTFVINDDFERKGLSEAELASSKALGMRAMVASTARRGERSPLSSLVAVSARPRRWTVGEVALVEEAAERTWAAMESARAKAALRESEQQQAFLLELSDAIRSLTTPLQIAEAATARLCERLKVNRVFYGEIDGYLLKVEHDHTRGVPSIVGEHSLKPFGPDYLAAYRPGAVIKVDDIEQDERLTEGARAGLRDRKVAASADAVLFEDNGAVSLLAVQSATPHAWVNADEELIREVAQRVRSAVKRVRTEAALRESEARLRTLAEGIPQLVWRSADEGRWTWSSPQWQAFTGQSLEDSLGRGWLDVIHPDDCDAVMQSWAKAPGEGAIDVEYRVRSTRDGAYLWHHTRSVPVRDENGHIVEWLGTTTDVDVIRGLQARQEVLVNELQHRARNLLGVVTAVVGRTLRQGGSVGAFEERLQALSRAQGLLSQGGSDTVEVGAIVHAELAPYVRSGSEQVRIGGSEVHLTARQVQNFALALHELTTNAVKYGALKGDSGHLAVTWEITPDRRGRRRLALSWVETGVVVRPEAVTRRGYGTELIQEALAYALEADVEYELGSDGVRCRIEMPVS